MLREAFGNIFLDAFVGTLIALRAFAAVRALHFIGVPTIAFPEGLPATRPHRIDPSVIAGAAASNTGLPIFVRRAVLTVLLALVSRAPAGLLRTAQARLAVSGTAHGRRAIPRTLLPAGTEILRRAAGTLPIPILL